MRDESLHCRGIVKLYHAFNAETGACVTKSVADDIVDCCKTVVALEDLLHRSRAFSTPSEVQGMTPDDIKSHDSLHRRLAGCARLALLPVYGANEIHCAAALQSLLSGVEHADR